MVVGLVSQGWAQVSRIAEGVPEAGRYNTVRQRVKRWVSNDRLDLTAVREEWISWVWRSLGTVRAVLLVDETKLGDRWAIRMVSLAYAGRAIPLYWRCYRANEAAAYPAQWAGHAVDLLGFGLNLFLDLAAKAVGVAEAELDLQALRRQRRANMGFAS